MYAVVSSLRHSHKRAQIMCVTHIHPKTKERTNEVLAKSDSAGCRTSSPFFRVDSYFDFIISNAHLSTSHKYVVQNGRSMLRTISEAVRNSVLIPSYNSVNIFVCVWNTARQLKEQFLKYSHRDVPYRMVIFHRLPTKNPSASGSFGQGGTITLSKQYRSLPLTLVAFQNLKVRAYY